jgi:hypothetical protein
MATSIGTQTAAGSKAGDFTSASLSSSSPSSSSFNGNNGVNANNSNISGAASDLRAQAAAFTFPAAITLIGLVTLYYGMKAFWLPALGSGEAPCAEGGGCGGSDRAYEPTLVAEGWIC